MEYARMRLELDGPAGVVEFDRPPANAYDLAFLEELDQVVEEVRRRDDIKVLVLRGNDRFFSAGADINMFLGASPEHGRDQAPPPPHRQGPRARDDGHGPNGGSRGGAGPGAGEPGPPGGQ